MVVGVCRVDLYISGSSSLKDKRQVLRKVIGRVREKFELPLNEVGHNDLWQRAQLGFAIVGNDRTHVGSLVDSIVNFIRGLYVAEVVDRKMEILTYGDELGE